MFLLADICRYIYSLLHAYNLTYCSALFCYFYCVFKALGTVRQNIPLEQHQNLLFYALLEIFVKVAQPAFRGALVVKAAVLVLSGYH